MNSVQERGAIDPRVVAIVLIAACGLLHVSCSTNRSAQDQAQAFRQMPDGKQWSTQNLNVSIPPSYCYDETESNCRRYGRLYTWESAQRGCRSLGDGWRLPTNDQWKQMVKHYGGVRDDSVNSGKAAYQALLVGGGSGFDARLGGGRSDNGEYAGLEAHGFCWTASESDPVRAGTDHLRRLRNRLTALIAGPLRVPQRIAG